MNKIFFNKNIQLEGHNGYLKGNIQVTLNQGYEVEYIAVAGGRSVITGENITHKIDSYIENIPFATSYSNKEELFKNIDDSEKHLKAVMEARLQNSVSEEFIELMKNKGYE